MGGLLRDRNYIAGAWVSSSETFPVTDPATGAVIARVARAGAAETTQAIAAATAAFPDWRDRLAGERAALLRRWSELMLTQQGGLARLLSREQGKPLAESRGEVAYAASFLQWFAEEARRVDGIVIPTFTRDARVVVLRQPIGVVAAITPWNFPLAMITRKIGAALAVGCTAIVKPASETPLSALALAALAEEAGIPAGVCNVVAGDTAAIARTLMASPEVRKISFTGSTAVGKELLRQSADTLKKVTLELGGNAPFLVFPDADIDAAVEGAVASKFRNSGQTCVCVNRFFVHADVYDEFARKLTARVRALRLGPALEGDADQGPLINATALAKAEEHVADALAKGAGLACGGAVDPALGGTFFQPTVLTEARPDMLLAQEETFAPVAALFRFQTDAEAVAAANATPYGLAAYFYTRDIGRVWRVAEALEVGMVGINTGLISSAVAPFGGVKESGMGREGSKLGVEPYLETKYLLMGGLG
ncbi:MAG: NAD-dependent succinate-semialdehyde dehydrogenase [Candidatus Nanopelagicales bacterium]